MLNYSSLIDNTPPKNDEIEISLFGPGVGECVLVHLGCNNWIVIDSCLNPSTKSPIAIDYLSKIGLSPPDVIKLLIASHWHNDHIRGLSEILKVCETASICYSTALLKKEFLTLVSAFTGIDLLSDQYTSGPYEIKKIINILQERCLSDPNYLHKYMIPTRADQILFETSLPSVNVSVRALSPSNKSVQQSLIDFASLIPNPEIDQFRKILHQRSPNNTAIVIWIKVGNIVILLGSDLEENNDPLTGWSAIINSTLRSHEKAAIFKVPHHGSVTSHLDEVWQLMIEQSAVCILTSNIGGISPLPQKKDIDRLKNYSDKIFCTHPPSNKKLKRDHLVEKVMKGAIKYRKTLGGTIGHIQVRVDSNSNVQVNLSDSAIKI